MKAKLLFIAVLGCNLTFAQPPGQAFQNQSLGGVSGNTITTAAGSPSTEIFRFRPGVVTQLDSGSGFTTDTSQWFALGRVGGAGSGFNQTFYGMRFQQPNRGLLMGYTSASPNNPIIQWIGTGAGLGNFEFRVATSFNSTVSTLVALCMHNKFILI